jgi:error-prone DNA polymerase
VRLGFRQLKGFRQAHAEQIVAARDRSGPFESVEDFHRRSGLPVSAIRQLTEGDAFGSLGTTRRQAVWQAMRLRDDQLPLFEVATGSDREPRVLLPTMPMGQEVMTDYSTAGLSLKRHPVSFARDELTRRKIITAAMLKDADRFPQGRWTKVAGLVLVRQRPGTASGVVFITLEDETGTANLILWSSIYEQYRLAARHATLLQADGYVQREGQVIHLLAKRLFDLSDLISGYSLHSRDFH